MTLKTECIELMQMLEGKGIKYPNEIYKKAKMIKTTIEGIENIAVKSHRQRLDSAVGGCYVGCGSN